MVPNIQNSKPRILHVGALPPPQGGMHLFFQSILDSRLKDSFENRYIDMSRGEMYAHAQPYQPPITGNAIFRRLRIAQQIFQVGREFRPDIIFFHSGWGDLSFLSDCLHLLIARRVSRRVICLFHGLPENMFPSQNIITRLIFQLAVAQTDRWLVLSEKYKRQFAGIIPIGKIAVVPSTSGDDLIDLPVRRMRMREENGSSTDILTVLFLGRLTQPKGAFDLIEAAKYVVESNRNVRFYLCGAGERPEDEHYLAERIRDLNLEETVYLRGVVQGEIKKAIFAESNILVLPSYSDSLGMTVMEGMAAGLPVISTPVGCLDEIVKPGINGFLFQPGNIDDLAHAILRLAANPDLREQMGFTNRNEFLNHYSLSIVIDRIEHIYQEIL